jgi:hypothetical protein
MRRIRATAAAATAPAMIADQVTAGVETSPVPLAAIGRTIVVSAILLSPVQCQKMARRMMIGIGTPSSQSKIPRPILLLLWYRQKAI